MWKELSSSGRRFFAPAPFNNCPFKQLFTIHGFIKDEGMVKQAPLFLAFMSRYQNEDYIGVIKKVKEILLKPLHYENDPLLVLPLVKNNDWLWKSLYERDGIAMVGSDFRTNEAADLKENPKSRIVCCDWAQCIFRRIAFLKLDRNTGNWQQYRLYIKSSIFFFFRNIRFPGLSINSKQMWNSCMCMI